MEEGSLVRNGGRLGWLNKAYFWLHHQNLRQKLALGTDFGNPESILRTFFGHLKEMEEGSLVRNDGRSGWLNKAYFWLHHQNLRKKLPLGTDFGNPESILRTFFGHLKEMEEGSI